MTKHKTGTRNEWLAARLELLDAEKELTRRSDELARQRQDLPWVRIDKEYRFETDEGQLRRSPISSEDARSSSSIISCSGPSTRQGVRPARRSRTASIASLSTSQITTSPFPAVSRAPLAKLQAFKRRMGWSFPWASSFGSDFNYDFQASRSPRSSSSRGSSSTTSSPRNVRRRRQVGDPLAEIAANLGRTWLRTRGKRPGMSAFALEDGLVYHTYSAYARGLDGLWGMYQWLDRAPTRAQRERSGGAICAAASGTAATTSMTRAERSHGCRWRNRGTGDLTTHVSRTSFSGKRFLASRRCSSLPARL